MFRRLLQSNARAAGVAAAAVLVGSGVGRNITASEPAQHASVGAPATRRILALSPPLTPEIDKVRREAFFTVKEAIDIVEQSNGGVPRGLHRFGSTWRNYTADAGQTVDQMLGNVQGKLQLSLLLMRQIQEYERESDKLSPGKYYLRLQESTEDLKKSVVSLLETVRDTRVEAVSKISSTPWEGILDQGLYSRIDTGLLKAATPAPPQKLTKILQPVSKGETAQTIVCLYFSAGWCGPCRRFTPRLIEAYNTIKKEHSDFEVVFVSWDQNSQGWSEYMQEMSMPFVALDFQQRELAQLLAMKSDVESIPRLLVLQVDHNNSGITSTKVLVNSGNSDVEQLGADVYKKWTQQ